MKTPDEIKKGLEVCSNDTMLCYEKCPYFSSISNGVDCAVEMKADALAYIQQLEERNTWHEGNEKYLASFMKDLSKQIEQLEAEKKQLLEDLADHCGSKTLCKKYEDGTCPHEYDCTLYLSTCEDYEWRGLPEVDE